MSKPNQLNIEECKALFFDETALLEPSRKLFRLNGYSAGRYYYSFNEGNEVEFFISVTNLIKQTMPTPDPLLKWIASMGYDESQAYAQERADYGTFMHIQFQSLLINKVLDLDSLDDQLKAWLQEQRQPQSLYEQWIDEIKKDVLGFAQFVRDYKVVPLAIEVMLASQDGYAGAVDLVCLMTIEEKGFFGEVLKSGPNKGQPKETKRETGVIGIVDFKSGRKNFYEAHEIQLEAYRNLVRENFPSLNMNDVRLYNYSPSEWRTKPGYKLKDQTNSPNRDKFPLLCSLARIEMSKRDKKITRITGVLDLNEPVEKVYHEIMISDLVKYDYMNREGNAVEVPIGGDIPLTESVITEEVKENMIKSFEAPIKTPKRKRQSRKKKSDVTQGETPMIQTASGDQIPTLFDMKSNPTTKRNGKAKRSNHKKGSTDNTQITDPRED